MRGFLMVKGVWILMLSLAALAVLLMAGVNPVQEGRVALAAFLHLPPPGRYLSSNGDIYEVTPFGPTTLSIWRGGECLLFWEMKGSSGNKISDETQEKLQITRLVGQSCQGGQFNRFTWIGTFRATDLKTISIFPARYSDNEKVKAVKLVYQGAI